MKFERGVLKQIPLVGRKSFEIKLVALRSVKSLYVSPTRRLQEYSSFLVSKLNYARRAHLFYMCLSRTNQQTGTLLI